MSLMTWSSDLSPTRLATKPVTPCAADIGLTARYLSTPQRATASSSSSKSSSVASGPPPPPSPLWLAMNAALAWGTDSRHWWTAPARVSPTTSDLTVELKLPTALSPSSSETHCAMPSLEEDTAGSRERPLNQVARFSLASVSAACTCGSRGGGGRVRHCNSSILQQFVRALRHLRVLPLLRTEARAVCVGACVGNYRAVEGEAQRVGHRRELGLWLLAEPLLLLLAVGWRELRVRLGTGRALGRGVGARENSAHLRELVLFGLEPHINDKVVELFQGHCHRRGITRRLTEALGVGAEGGAQRGEVLLQQVVHLLLPQREAVEPLEVDQRPLRAPLLEYLCALPGQRLCLGPEVEALGTDEGAILHHLLLGLLANEV
eukprot:scaffold22955_cov58-Phaeocystis_antarctica.AAC.3